MEHFACRRRLVNVQPAPIHTGGERKRCGHLPVRLPALEGGWTKRLRAHTL